MSPEFIDKILYFDNIKYKDDDQNFNYDLISLIISDLNLQLLWSRFDRFKRKNYKTEISRFEYQIKTIKSAIFFINHYKISKIIFAYEPHNLPMYIFKSVCVKMGIENTSFNFSPFPNRIFAIDGIKNKIIKNSSSEKFDLNQFISSRKFKNKKNFKKRLFSLESFNKSILYNFIYHRNLLKLSSSRKDIFKTNYILFLLHYQPESTTLPDGGLFVSQHEALKIILKVCKKLNLNLVVREHPATNKYFNKNWRNKEYIKSIYNLGKNVMIDDHRESNIDIILRSKATASISGTVITESLINGIPSIAFGKHPLKGWNGDSFVEFENDMNKFILKISKSLNLKKHHIKKEIENYLKDLGALDITIREAGNGIEASCVKPIN